jgi:hypothetical protein
MLADRIAAAGILRRDAITPNTPIASLIPRRGARQHLAVLAAILGVKLPPPQYPLFVSALMLFTPGLPILGGLFWLVAYFNCIWLAILWLPGMFFMIRIMLWLDGPLAPRFCNRIPTSIATLAGVAYLSVIESAPSENRPWNEAEIWATIQFTLASLLAKNPRCFRRRTRFVELGLA